MALWKDHFGISILILRFLRNNVISSHVTSIFMKKLPGTIKYQVYVELFIHTCW